MPSVTFRVPDSIRTNGYIADPVPASGKARLAAILTRNDLTTPARVIPEISVHANIWLNAADEKRLADLGAPNEMSVGETITALLVADAAMWAAPVMGIPVAAQAPCHPALARVLASLKLGQRGEQSRFYAGLEKLLSIEDPAQLPRVLFAEAGTGIGKTLAYMAGVHAFLKSLKTAQTAIAVPTHALMDQTLREWRKVQDALGEPVSTATLIGQNEFVSVQALTDLLPDIDQTVREQITTWIGKSGPCDPDAVIRHAWTVGALRKVAPLFNRMRDVTLSERDTDDDPGYVSYREQWDSLPRCSIVVMSHAMLASLVLRRLTAQARATKDSAAIKEATAAWVALTSTEREKRLYQVLNDIYAQGECEDGLDLLPNLDLLVVDEAHTLEDSFNLVLSQNISMYRLHKDIERLHASHPKQITSATVAAMTDVWQRLRRSGSASVDKVMSLHDDDKNCLIDLGAILKGVLEIKSTPKNQLGSNAGFRRIAQIARSVTLALLAGEQYGGSIGAMIDWSPDRKWPRLMVGRLSTAREMNYLWLVVARRSILVSGTLYEELPQVSCETARRSLSVPFDMMMTMEPVYAPWQYKLVTACVVADTCAADGRRRFLRPVVKDSSPEAVHVEFNALYAGWVEDVGRYLVDAHKVAQGGMLVLGTAFRDIADIGQLIEKNTSHPVLVHHSGVPLASLRDQFLAAANGGKRPVLLAVSGAWTGFDLHSPINPNALTDLAILNAPFGAITRSLARQKRARQKNGIFEIVGLTVVLIRQGVGRLVRSPDTPANRRIHWLDARIHHAATAGLFNPIKRLLVKYKVIAVS
ncbi:DEAD/DEAH box helicase-like (plasmid) [Rhodoferax ferrireducens T118]|uniref:DEAD/DEAH box helicase-like n=1 Tax=Albidiferax ferrireducens (strain ATCC BAA-621 / DSM 15236 / T118) TaxID=338969 RepID=Q21QA5_ALBFT|nr:type IV CRISPR-associated DEAD/DEAH-box helicase Csf4 [Rhodoferax ferrireducens]ABD72040.1 DEAD/DEAH box helicase-like [Rhodoferax ferrireducens T118]